MMAAPYWLENEDEFERFRLDAEAHLESLRSARILFLERARPTIADLLREAQALRADDLIAQLTTGLDWAAEELETLRCAPSPLSPVLDGDIETAALETGPIDEPPTPGEGLGGLAPAAETAAAPSSPKSAAIAARAERDSVPSEGTSPQGAPTVPAFSRRSVAPPRQSADGWTPRDRTTIDSEVDRIAAEMRAEGPTGETGLLQLKAAASRLRHAYEELEFLGHYLGDVKAARGALQARSREEQGDPYVVPLDTNIRAVNPALWGDLASAYERLIPAVEAFTWFREYATVLKTNEAEDLLDGIGATQQQLFRLLCESFHAGDEQQKQLYSDLRESADALSIFLPSLSPAATAADLHRSAVRVEKKFRDLRNSVEKRLAQETALAAVQRLLEEPGFGTHLEDAERLQAVARLCLEAGVPKTKPELRNTLLEWEALLDGGAGLVPLCDEIAREKERRLKKGQPIADEAEERGTKRLSPEIEQLRRELVAYTRGKRCLFVGGHVREEYRSRIQEALELKDLEWPETDRFDASPKEFTSQINRTDIVVLLIRFMRTGMKGTTELCKEQGKAVVRLPRGLNVSRVVTNFHEQLIPSR
jgi:hypothetical protein